MIKYLSLILTASCLSCSSHPTSPFDIGEKIENQNFNGNAYLNSLIKADSLGVVTVGQVTFEAGSHTRWHLHPAGQILIVLDGIGYYQEKGGPKIILRKGDVHKCTPNLPHWHGASQDKDFVQLAITDNKLGITQWLEPVTQEEYLQE